jgi:hypothetical protein
MNFSLVSNCDSSSPRAEMMSKRTLDDRFDFVSTTFLYGIFDWTSSDVQRPPRSPHPHRHIGPQRLQRLDCAQVIPSLPTWLRLPPGRTSACVQLGDAAPFTRVLSHRRPMPITKLWTRHFEPHLDELKLPLRGGSTGGGTVPPASRRPQVAQDQLCGGPGARQRRSAEGQPVK